MAPLSLERGFSLPVRRCAGADLLKRQQRDALWPLVKIISPVGTAAWLIAPMNPQDEDTLYGLCDPGLGYPELGYVQLSALQGMTVRVPSAGSVAIGLEQDPYFKPGHSLSAYAEAARQNGTITDNPRLLDAAQDRR